MECSVCGISGKNVRLLDVISPKGIVKVCAACSEKDDMPILRRPTTFQLKESEKKPETYSSFLAMRKKEKDSGVESLKKSEDKDQEITLKGIVDKNYKMKISEEKKPRPDLIDNFHWDLMRTRRLKKITQEELAKEISESVVAIKMAEQGILPEDDYRLVNKLESFLGIKIIKDNARFGINEISRKSPARILKFDRMVMQNLTISDLKEIKEKKEEPSEDLKEDLEKNEREAEVL